MEVKCVDNLCLAPIPDWRRLSVCKVRLVFFLFGSINSIWFSGSATEGNMANSLVDSYITEASKLNGDNYVNLEFKLITILEALDLWTIVKGDEHKPSVTLSMSDWNLR